MFLDGTFYFLGQTLAYQNQEQLYCILPSAVDSYTRDRYFHAELSRIGEQLLGSLAPIANSQVGVVDVSLLGAMWWHLCAFQFVAEASRAVTSLLHEGHQVCARSC